MYELQYEGESVDQTVLKDCTEKIGELLRGYAEEDMYYYDESSLFFSQMKNASLVTHAERKDKNGRDLGEKNKD